MFWNLKELFGAKEKEESRTLVAYLDGEPGNVLLTELLKVNTIQKLKQQVEQHFKLPNPKLFLLRNGREIKEDKDFNEYVEVVVVVSKSEKLTSLKSYYPVPDGPKALPLIGNALDLFPFINESSIRLRNEHGNIFKIHFPRIGELIFIGHPQYADTIFQDPQLWQKLHMKTFPLRERVGTGLFTSDDDEVLWGMAHRILLPAFSNSGMQKYFYQMVECADLFVDALHKISSKEVDYVDINEYSPLFTLEVISRVAFGEKLDAFSSKPAIFEYLEDGLSDRILTSIIPSSAQSRVSRGIKNMRNYVMNMIIKRRKELAENTTQEKDLLTLMLNEVDPVTKEKLPDSNIVSQVMTLLVAGHDSTSTAITSLIYHLAAHPQVEAKVIEEIDQVLDGQSFTFQHLGRLKYCYQVLCENLRLLPPAPALIKNAVRDTTLGNFFIPKGSACFVNIWAMHYNPEVWPNPEKFNPDRFNEEEVAKRSPSAWMPFSYGPRACIGQQLSIIEQKIFLVLVYRKFYFRLHKSANIHITFPLFAKPEGVNVVVSPREHSNKSLTVSQAEKSQAVQNLSLLSVLNQNQQQNNSSLLILFGSNNGTCNKFAENLSIKGRSFGFDVSVSSLDEFLESKNKTIPKNGAVVIITSTYNGEPPDNAKKFTDFLKYEKSQTAKLFSGVYYAVFGVGNSQWRRTFLLVPTIMDQALEEAGGKRITNLGKGDCDKAIDDDFEEWQLSFWLQISEALKIRTLINKDNTPLKPISVKFVDSKPDAEIYTKFKNAHNTKVIKNAPIQGPDSTRSLVCMEFELNEDQRYETGDYLAVFPKNDEKIIQHVLKVLNVDPEAVIVIESNDEQFNYLPTNKPIDVLYLLRFCVELQQPATRTQICYLATKTECPPEKKTLEALCDTDNSGSKSYEEYILNSKRTLIQLLEEFKSIKLEFAEFLTMISPLRPRYYSISSSSLLYPKTAHVAVSVVSGETPTGRYHLGVASNYLKSSPVGDDVRLLVKKSTFRLPTDTSKPIILVGPGTGVAPLRAFIQERKASNSSGDNILFYGCRNDSEFLYKEELESYKEKAFLNLFVAFSRQKNQPRRYVQDLIEENGALVYAAISKGAYIFVCGEAKSMAPAVKEAIVKIIQIHGNKTKELATEEVHSLLHCKRYLEDVWAA